MPTIHPSWLGLALATNYSNFSTEFPSPPVSTRQWEPPSRIGRLEESGVGIDAPASDQLASRQGSSCSCSCSLASLFLFLAVSLPFLTAANRSVMRSSCLFQGQLFPEPCLHFQGRDGIQGFRLARPSPILGVLSVCICVMTAIENVSIHRYTQGSWLVILSLLR